LRSNRLIHEKSPYLLQHAHNPVDWYPWGAEAFQKAQHDNKPVLISIGYSTCHWCHVMEHESFENAEMAALMNDGFVCIKVDREERPDVDAIYMSAVQAMAGQGGWPLNVFVTPDREPFFGGTYFPPDARWGHPGWREVLSQISAAWQDPKERERIREIGQNLTQALQKHAARVSVPLAGDASWLDGGFQVLKESFDAARGGFSKAPKFPMPVYHNFLLRHPNPEARPMSLATLRAMAQGGLYDQLGGGFARYSTDDQWHIPHFEKMLYDNAQLVVNYLEAYQISGEDDFRNVVRETLDYIHREMTHPDGGYYSAEDADSLPTAAAKEKIEGAFYVWEQGDIDNLLGKSLAELFNFRYGVRAQGNAASDPHGDFKNKNILYQAHPIPETAREFKLTIEETSQRLNEARTRLFAARAKRPRPHLDDKIITGWNGLMISAMARAYQVLGGARDLASAQKAARFVRMKLWDERTKRLFRRWRDDQADVRAIADDYAFLTQALLDLYEADFDTQWLDWAMSLTETMIKDYEDIDHGGFFLTALDQDPHLLYRSKEDQDNVEPSASAIAAVNLLRLAQLTGREEYLRKAERTLQSSGSMMKSMPRAMPQMLVALQWGLTDPMQIVVAGVPGAADTEALLAVVRKAFIPQKVVMLVDGGKNQAWLSERLDYLKTMTPLAGKATAYVCEKRICKKPVQSTAELEKLLLSSGVQY